MLQRIYIKNFAIIDELEICPAQGLNIITGETGAGKSIIVDAIDLVIGGRASSDMIRYDESKAIIECTFNTLNYRDMLEGLIDYDDSFPADELIIRREINRKGTSRCFVNDSPANVSKLKEIGELLVDFHGQHEHQSLLNPRNHIEVIDAFANAELTLAEYCTIYNELKQLIADFKQLKAKKKELTAKYDIMKFQIDEIKKVHPKANEDIELEAELKKLENAEFLASLSGELHSIMNDSDNSIYNHFIRSEKIIEQLSEYENGFEEFSDEISSMIIAVKEIAAFSKDFASEIEYNPAKIEAMRHRYSELKKLNKKYGSINEALEIYEKNLEEIALIEKFDDKSGWFEDDIKEKSNQLAQIGFQLHNLRKAKSISLSQEIEDRLKYLGFENARFDVKFSFEEERSKDEIFNKPCGIQNGKIYSASPLGIDKAEFLIAANVGSEPKPLSETASGGEISRVMLAIKGILAGKDKVPVMVFDEIDTGISGRIAQKVGFSMKELASSRQIIAITHLPQIAALGDMNIAVSKMEADGKTFAKAIILNPEQRTLEVAKLISGEKITDAALESAVQLINSK